MNLQDTQRWIHRVNVTAALVLLTTGLLHTLPDVRSFLIGGYDRLVADIHLWSGAVFIVFPVGMVLLSGRTLLDSLRLRIFRDPVWHWRRFYLSATILICSMQASAGVLIFIDTLHPLPLAVVDVLFAVHHFGAWYVGLMLPVHLWMARRAMVRIVRGWFAPSVGKRG